MLALEKTVSKEILDNVRKTLTPFLGLANFQVSVATKLNTDKKQTNETTYNPESRVERSVQVVRANDQANQRQAHNRPARRHRHDPDPPRRRRLDHAEQRQHEAAARHRDDQADPQAAAENAGS